MELSLIILKLAITTLLCNISPTKARLVPDQTLSMLDRHEQWMLQYNRVHKDEQEKAVRFKIFSDNVDFIEMFNKAEDKPYKLGLNAFADMTPEEFKSSRNGLKIKTSSDVSAKTSFKYENVSSVPSSIDWREKGAVTPIKDQGQCGSCWAFSAIAATEGINQISTKKLISLSEQEIVDCDRTIQDQGCGGGYMEDAFAFIVKNKGIASESKYPYIASDGTCNKSKESLHAAKISGYEKVPANSEADLLKAVANQPVSVSIEAIGIMFYKSGIFNGPCGTNLDHGVTVVGYGKSENVTNYWLVKNSWGTSWGEEGYIRMERGIKAKEGLCGIAMDSSYPWLDRSLLHRVMNMFF